MSPNPAIQGFPGCLSKRGDGDFQENEFPPPKKRNGMTLGPYQLFNQLDIGAFGGFVLPTLAPDRKRDPLRCRRFVGESILSGA